jgi:hypothetical protein
LYRFGPAHIPLERGGARCGWITTIRRESEARVKMVVVVG